MTKTFCDCCGQEINGSNPKFDTIILSLKMVAGAVIVSPTGKPWQYQDFCEKCVANEVWAELAVRLREMKHKDHPKVIITPPPLPNPFINLEANRAIEKMVEETWRHQASLERKHFKDAFLQAIRAGDFTRVVQVDRLPYIDGQTGGRKEHVTVTYKPFTRVQELERQIELMKRPCDKCGQVMSPLSGEDA